MRNLSQLRDGRTGLRLDRAREADSLLRTERPSITSNIPDNLSEVLGILDDVDVAEHLEISEIVGDTLLLERGDECMIGVEVGDDLEAAGEGDDLAFQMALKDAGTQSECEELEVESASLLG